MRYFQYWRHRSEHAIMEIDSFPIMVRILTIGGMAAGFLIISPGLRGNVTEGYSIFVRTINDLAPWSYIAIGAFFFMALTSELYQHALPKDPGIPKE